MKADFTITIKAGRKPMAVRVKVHDSLRALRTAAVKYDRRVRPNDPESFGPSADFVGICHRIHSAKHPVVAVVRLAPPHLGIGVMSHEMAHAAVWMWEIQNKFNRKIPLICSNDEWFCWVLGELVRCTTAEFYELGIYP